MINTKQQPKNTIIFNRLEKYKCDICFKVFQDSSGLRKHKKKKTACILLDEFTKITNNTVIQEIEFENTVQKLLKEKEKHEIESQEKMKLLLEENKKKENEIIRLRNLMEMNSRDVKKIIEGNEQIKEKLSSVENKIDDTSNPNVNYNLTQLNNNSNKNLNFNIQLAQKEKERFDHIPVAQMLCILDQKDFSHSIADLVQAVSFNPKAPENMTWCINDKKSENGAIEYNSELNILTRDSSTSVISKNLQSILYPVTDMLKEIELTSTFNKQQNQNYDRYFNLLGELDIKKEYINSIKERAFDKRGLCKALWEHLQIGLESEKIKLKTKII